MTDERPTPGMTINLRAVFRLLRDAIAESKNATQGDYTLAGPEKGGDR